MITNADTKRQEKIINFFKTAFCVDGNVHIVMENEKKSFGSQ